jgi:aryl-alcohol dehydrogenase-like predicted oxidoreductase
MRFRPFGATGTVVSALSLALTDVPNRRRAADWQDLVIQAMENGVNTFEIAGANPAIMDGLADALQTVDRHLVFVTLRLGQTANGGRDFSASYIAHMIEATVTRMDIGYLDLVLLDDPGEDELSAEAMATCKAMRAAGRTRMIGVRGKGTAMDAYISASGFDVVALPYSLSSGWMDRHRLKAASDKDMAVIGYDFFPEAFHKPEDVAVTKKSFWGKAKVVNTLANAGTYAFLHDTPRWTAEEICLAFALTEPALATIQISTEDAAQRLTDLAKITERDMPPGAASRIEMARFGDHKNGAQA